MTQIITMIRYSLSEEKDDVDNVVLDDEFVIYISHLEQLQKMTWS